MKLFFWESSRVQPVCPGGGAASTWSVEQDHWTMISGAEGAMAVAMATATAMAMVMAIATAMAYGYLWPMGLS